MLQCTDCPQEQCCVSPCTECPQEQSYVLQCTECPEERSPRNTVHKPQAQRDVASPSTDCGHLGTLQCLVTRVMCACLAMTHWIEERAPNDRDITLRSAIMPPPLPTHPPLPFLCYHLPPRPSPLPLPFLCYPPPPIPPFLKAAPAVLARSVRH